MNAFVVSEMRRMLENLFHYGKVLEVSEDGTRAKCLVDGKTTDFLPVGFRNTKTDVGGAPLNKDQQVFIIAPYGDLTQAVVAFSLYMDADIPPRLVEQPKVVFEDGTTLAYDKKNKVLDLVLGPDGTINIDAKGGQINAKCKTGKITASDAVEVECKSATVTGDSIDVTGKTSIKGATSITGTLTVTGGVTAASVSAGSGAISGGSVSATGDVTAGGVSLTTHTHDYKDDGNPATTTTPGGG